MTILMRMDAVMMVATAMEMRWEMAEARIGGLVLVFRFANGALSLSLSLNNLASTPYKNVGQVDHLELTTSGTSGGTSGRARTMRRLGLC
jgi:hypothetical protein